MKKILGPEFFNRKTALVAEDLLGKYLVRKIGRKVVAEMITETEAYIGPHDLACHSSKGRTRRTKVMFCGPSTIYIYLVYGMYWMLNVVTEEEGFPAAVLIRETKRFHGPGVLTRELRIDKNLNGKLTKKSAGLWFENRGEEVDKKDIICAPRIGVNYAGPIWSKKKLRFRLES